MSQVDLEDLNDFLKKVDDVGKQLQGLVDGTLDPKDVRPTDNDWAYNAATAGATKASGEASSKTLLKAATKTTEEEQERAKARELNAKWDAERAERESKDERDRWWRFAKLQYGDDGVNAPEPVGDEPVKPTGEALRKVAGPIDYSWWDKWASAPDDPASIAEREREAAAKERAQDEAFEKANPGFCSQFKSDQDKREAAEAKKKRKADALKDAGNEAFKAGNLQKAVSAYVEAIRVAPFTVPALNNMAATYLAMGHIEGAIEFGNRVLHIEKYGTPAAIKALFRRGSAHRSAGRLPAAEADFALAATHDGINSEVLRELAAVRLEIEERGKEEKVMAVIKQDGADTAPALCDSLLLVMNAHTESASAHAVALPRAAIARLIALVGGTDSAAEDARVYFRACGLLQCMCAAVVRTLSLLTSDAHTRPGALLSIPSAADVLLLLTASVENAKNRVMISDTGVLTSTLDMLTVDDSTLLSTASRAFLQGNEAVSVSSSSSALLGLLDAALLLVLASLHAHAPPAVRAGVATHPFIRGSWRARSSTFHSHSAPPGTLDVTSRLHACAVVMASELDVPSILSDSSRTCAQLLNQVCLPDDALTIAPPSGKGKGSAQTVVDPVTAGHRQALTAVVDGFGDAESVDARSSSNEAPCHPVTALLQLITVLIGRSLFNPGVLQSPLMQAALAALVALAQCEPLRPAFALPAQAVSPRSSDPHPSGVGVPPVGVGVPPVGVGVPPVGVGVPPVGVGVPPALHPLLDLLRLPLTNADVGGEEGRQDLGQWDAVRGTALAALANACVAPSLGGGSSSSTPTVLAALAGAGATDVLVGFLGGSQTGEVRDAALPVDLRARAALLLGRLSSEPAAAAALSEPALVARATALLKLHVKRLAACSLAEAQFQDRLMRLLASSTSSSPSCLAAFLAEGGPAVVVAVLNFAVPTLARGCGVDGARHVGVGNAAKVLITVSGEEAQLAGLVQAGAVDVLVEALKAPSGDAKEGAGAAVRKNAAVALARLARHPAGKERLVATRGLEILMQVGK